MSHNMISAKFAIDKGDFGASVHKNSLAKNDSKGNQEFDEIKRKVAPDLLENGCVQPGIALFESQRCTFVEKTGASCISRLPFNVEAAWPLRSGILLERRILCSDRYHVAGSNCNIPANSLQVNDTIGEPHSLFTIFLMSHPLDEMSPVLMKIPGAKGSSTPKMCFANDENQRIVGVVDKLGLVVTTHKVSGLHSIWYLDKARVEDYAHLYLIDEEGRITVAPEALVSATTENSAISNNPETPIVSTPVEMKNPVAFDLSHQTPPPRRRFQHLSIASSPYLSPFRASLQKLKDLAKLSAFKRRDSVLPDSVSSVDNSESCIPDVMTSAVQPVDLDEHIRRLSMVSFLPPRRFGPKASPDIVQNSGMVSDSFRNIRRNSKGSLILYRSRSRQNSLSKAYNTIPGIFATSAHPQKERCLGVGDELEAVTMALDEPLLPKVCLSLMWTEKPEDQPLIPFPATPYHKRFNNAGDVQGLLVNPRVTTLVNQPVARSSLTRGLQQQRTPSENGPHRPRVFLARDLIDRCYVCLLNGRRQLICLGVQEAMESRGKESEQQLLLGSQVTYLPAVDAIYVPESKLTVCLDPNDSIILYSGITRICILGVIPALVSTLPSVEGLNTGRLLPLSILPSKSECEVSSTKSEVIELLSSIREDGNPSVTEALLQANLETTNYCQALLISHLYPVSVTPHGGKTESKWRLCLPVDNQFTLALVQNAQGCGDEVYKRELQIHLPVLASVTIVQHCLSALCCGLPDEVALGLLSRWFCYRNPPNASDSCGELASFAHFLLTIVGLIPEDISVTMPSPMDTNAAVCTKRLRDKLHESETCNIEDDIIHQLLRLVKALSTDVVASGMEHSFLRHIPDILLCSHLVIENDQLNTLLVGQVRFLASLNHIIAMYSRFSNYVEYYTTSGLSLLTPNDLSCIPHLPEVIIDALYWSPHAQSAHESVPSLNRWCMSILSKEDQTFRTPYLYFPNINDTAATLATFIVCAQQDIFNEDPTRLSVADIMRFWSKKISMVAYERAPLEPGKSPHFDKEALKNAIVSAYIAASLKIVLGQLGEPAPSASYQRAVVFLSELDTQMTKKLAQMPVAYASIIQTTLVKCLAHPPPNCSPHGYQLIGRQDMARQFEIMRTSRSALKQKHSGRSLSSTKTGNRTREFDEVSCCNREQEPADRWFGLVRPIITNPCTDGMVVSRHFLLSTLENSPACQVAFDDLRLQEAYKMLQTCSHIWLPRSCTDETTFGPMLYPQSSNGSSSATDSSSLINIAKARLDMHLAAACVRTSAQPLGRGMLGLGIVVSSPPPLLTVYPLCLRGRSIPSSTYSLSAMPQQQDLARGGLVESRRCNTETSSGIAASDNPANATALAIISAVVATGCAGSLRTACSLSRLMTAEAIESSTGNTNANDENNTLSNAGIRRLMATASSAALSATSAISSSTLTHSAAVLAGQHWPEFHNGVAAGLMISPHTSIDATWIVQNYKAIALGASSSVETLNATTPSACPYSPAQAGFLFGLGLNGHLNKLSSHYIREFTIQVHDLTNAAVMLGLCAGKRGSMDQGVLRLLAVHYRPLLMPEPVLVDMSVPSLCQAAAAFGLGLLFKGSAHRHIANILLTELGRPLSGQQTTSASGNAVITNDALAGGGEGSNINDPSSNDANASNDLKIANAGGSGGFAGESRELISLSAGFALGLVLLQRGDMSGGLSDLALAHRLHAYMVGGRRDSSVYHLDTCFGSQNPTVDVLCIDIPRPPPGYPLDPYLQPHLLAFSGGRSRMRDKKPRPRNASILATPKVISEMSKEELLDLGISAHSAKETTISESSRLIASEDPLEAVIRETFRQNQETKASREVPIFSPQLAASAVRSPNYQQRQRMALIGQSAILNQSQQIREQDTYNSDMSAPGATIALGFAYLGTANTTVSGWLQAPNSFRELEMVRSDMLALRTISWGLVNFEGVEATIEWIEARIPACIVKVLTLIPLKKEQSSKNAEASSLVMSTETDVENRSPRGKAPSNECKKSSRRQPLSPKLSLIQLDSLLTLPEASKSSAIDYSTVAQAYLNILVGACFVIGLKFAGTCDSEATELLHTIVTSILTGDWWPPNRSNFAEVSSAGGSSSEHPPRLLDLPPMDQSVRYAAATVLTALAMVLAGSGNLTVLRMVRKLRAIRFFGRCPHKVSVSNSVTSSWPSPAETARLFQVAAVVAQIVPNVQPGANASPVNQPVSTAAVMGAVLAPDFGLQMVYGSIIGLLFLGGGRLTLSNTPEAAALLTISFFPRYPIYAGDNWYHLQCLRHLYVLATKPRRLCGVNILTNQVEPVTLKYWYMDKVGCFGSERTAVFTSDFWERGSKVQLSCGKVTTNFNRDTTEWKLLKKSLNESGFFFVTKAPFPGTHMHFTKNIDLCLLNWTNPSQAWQLRLMAKYLTSEWCAQTKDNQQSERTFDSSGVLAHSLTTRLMQQFLIHAKDIQRGLWVFFFGNAAEKRALPADVRAKTTSFRIWFSIFSAKCFKCHLPTDGPVSLSQFLRAVGPFKNALDTQALYWLYKLLYYRS
ncbi:hypothetical protein Aperf_G00000127576 [Anoplocephala perfoliata]